MGLSSDEDNDYLAIRNTVGARYAVVPNSLSGHCCFRHTVIDKSRPIYDDEVCETFDESSAKLVCNALNKEEEHNAERD